MLTSCPECRTTFRVTQEHLGLRRGLVRCGHCGVVFNAYDSLLAELVVPPAEPDKPVPELAADAAEQVAAPAEDRPIATDTLITADTPAAAPEEAPEPEAEPSSPEPEPPEQAPEAAPAAVETSESILLSELPTRRRAIRPPRFHLKLAAALCLAFTLLLQLAFFLRADLAAALPGTRPWLETLCRPLACVVPLPRQLDKAAIAASSLEHDAENKSRARLTLLLANRHEQAQAWPRIVLTLTDVRDAPVAQRVFTADEYLDKSTRQEAGMAAGEEREIRLDLDTGTLAATGYALDLAYP